jgi:hypothetical protein
MLNLLPVYLKNVSVEEALKKTFKDQPLDWFIENKTITLTRKPLTAIADEANRIPPIRVTGTIRDEEHIPIPGASVIVKGKGTGTLANENGGFTIDVNKGDVLIFSSSSHVEKQLRIEAKTVAIQLN